MATYRIKEILILMIVYISVIKCCSFTDPQGKKYDVDRITGKQIEVLSTDGTGSTFNMYLCSTNAISPCTVASPICLVRPDLVTYNLGRPNLTPWTPMVPYGSGVVANFYNGSVCNGGIMRSAIINLYCDQTVAAYEVVVAALTVNCIFRFDIKSCGGCPGGCTSVDPNPPGSSFDIGWILIIVAAGTLVLYFIIGAIVKYNVYNASGLELIPNVEFWTGLPGLVKDGVMFIYGSITGNSGGYAKV